MMDYSNLFSLAGKRALVVGAGNGIGAECAVGLAAHGATVTCADRDEQGLARTVARIAAADGTADAYPLDVLDADAVRRAAGALAVDVLLFSQATNVRKRMVDYSGEEFDRVIALNLRSSFDLIAAFGAAMAARGGGSIIAFTSIRAVSTEPGQSVYSATKAGLMQLLRTAAAELGPSGVRLNAIAPGVVQTALTQQIRADPEWSGAYASKSALGRWARPEEMVGAAVFLAGDAASFVTGSQLFVDGGWTAIDGRFEPPN